MIKQALIMVLSGLCLVMAVQPSIAAPQPKPAAPAAAQPLVPMSTVLQNLKMNGYDIIGKVELDKDVYSVEAMSPQGKEMTISMDAHSGVITNPKQNPEPHLGLQDAVKKVEAMGYHDISMIEYSGDKYVVKAMDQKDKKVKLKVDGNTGDITKAWF